MPALVQICLVFLHDGLGVSPGQDEYVIEVLLVNDLRRLYRDVIAGAIEVLISCVIVEKEAQGVSQAQVVD